MQGGTHQSGMISGFLGSIGASAFGMVASEFSKSAEGIVLSGAVLGGVGAELTRGNFWQSAFVGGIVEGLNHSMSDNDDEWMLMKDGKMVRVGIKGRNKTDYLYDETYGPNTNPTLLATTDVQNISYRNFSPGKTMGSARGFGYSITYTPYGGDGLYDPSFEIMTNVPLTGGIGLTKMGLTRVLKSDYGIRTVLGGSKTMLRSSHFFTNELRAGYKIGVRLPTLYKSTNNLGQFLGINSALIGGGMMYQGGRNFINKPR